MNPKIEAGVEAPVVLVCTVGGSPQPIATALRLLKPEAVWFVVSQRSIQNGKVIESSRPQVEDPEIEYDRGTKQRGPGLKFAEGCPPEIEIAEVPADDPDKTYSFCRSLLQTARRRFPEHRIVADYTGGTKSMTGGLLMAAFAESAESRIEVQFMAGERSDLVQVRAGSEQPQLMSADLVLADRDFAKAEQAIDHFDYEAAFRVANDMYRRLKRSQEPLPTSSGGVPLKAFRDWCETMSRWDCFSHDQAWYAVSRKSGSHPGLVADLLERSKHLAPLRQIIELGKDPPPNWRLCADLFRNAERRAAQGRFDDALLRLYRTVEAAAQAMLFELDGVLSANVPREHIGLELAGKLRFSAAGTAALALSDTVKHLSTRGERGRHFADRVSTRRDRDGSLALPAWITGRNHSILAHGFAPVKQPTWESALAWVEKTLVPIFQEKHAAFPQLPREIPRL